MSRTARRLILLAITPAVLFTLGEGTAASYPVPTIRRHLHSSSANRHGLCTAHGHSDDNVNARLSALEHHADLIAVLAKGRLQPGLDPRQEGSAFLHEPAPLTH